MSTITLDHLSEPQCQALQGVPPAPIAGLPGISVPAGLDSKGLPLGLQLIGRAFDEETLFKVAGVIESSADFKAKPEGF